MWFWLMCDLITSFENIQWKVELFFSYTILDPATLTYKALNGLTPEYITNMLTPNSQVHDRTLRSSVDGTLMVPRSRTSLYDKSFSVSAPKYWNSLPTDIKNAPSLSSFKTHLKDKLMVEITLNLSFPKNVLSFMRQSVTFTRSYLNQGNIILGWICLLNTERLCLH